MAKRGERATFGADNEPLAAAASRELAGSPGGQACPTGPPNHRRLLVVRRSRRASQVDGSAAAGRAPLCLSCNQSNQVITGTHNTLKCECITLNLADSEKWRERGALRPSAVSLLPFPLLLWTWRAPVATGAPLRRRFADEPGPSRWAPLPEA